MQHWHVYQKWNERLFHEMYSAYRLGRADKDPTEGWYKGELWFYDNYVVRLENEVAKGLGRQARPDYRTGIAISLFAF